MKWGPSARTCVDLARGSWEAGSYASKVREAALRFVQDYNPTQELNAIDVPHTLFSIHPVDNENLVGRTTMSAKIATEHLFQFIAEACADADAHRRVQFFHMINNHPSFKTTAGYIFERFFHTWLVCKGTSQALELHCHSNDSLISNMFRPSLIIPRCREVVIAGGLSSLKNVGDSKHEMPLGWIPSHQGLAAVDAIIFTKWTIITLQATIAWTHSAKSTGFKAIKEKLPITFESERKWHHVFITDDEGKAQSLRRQNLSELRHWRDDITIHSAVLEVRDLQITAKEMSNLEDRKVSTLASLTW